MTSQGEQAGGPARGRLEYLAAGGQILESSLDYETTLTELGQMVVPALADWYSVDLVDEQGTVTNLTVAHVDPAKVELAHELRRRLPPRPDDQTGPVQVARTGVSEWYREITDELLEQAIDDPETLRIVRDLGLRSSITVPLTARGEAFGTLTMVTAESGRLYEQADVRLAEELGKRAGLAINNARLFDAERRATERLATAARVSDLLAESLDYPGTYIRLAELMVRDLADLCLIDVAEPNGRIVRLAAVHADPSKQPVADRLLNEYPPVAGGTHPVARVIATGVPAFAPEMDPEFLRSTTRDEEHLRLVTELGFQSYLSVPLIARGATLGALTLVSTNPGRRYGSSDVELAQEIAGRAALHIDNSRLYAAQAKAARQAARLQSLIDVTFTAETLEGMLEGLLTRVTEELETQLAALLLTDESGSSLTMRAAVGLEDDVKVGVRVPVGQGFAGRVGATRQPLAVEDVRTFPVVSPYLKERVRSIVGVPLVLGNDVIGVLHTSSVTPRTFSSEDITLLQLAADRAAVAIRRAELYEQEHRIASLLQQSLLPAELPAIPQLELSALFHAAGRGVEVGGDFYDAFRIDGSTWCLVVGDVCGRGPEAAAVTGLAKNAIRALAMREPNVGSVLKAVNDTMIQSEVDRFCTAILARFHFPSGPVGVTVARAGLPPALTLRADGTVEPVAPEGALLGVFKEAAFSEATIELQPGDAFLLFADGLVEGNSPLQGEQELAHVLEGCVGLSAEEIANRLAAILGNPDRSLADDVAVLVARIRSSEAEE